jgi:hypothetical protein
LAGFRLDAAHDDYYDHDGSWPDLRDSVYLRRVGERRSTIALTVRGRGAVASPVPGLVCMSSCTTVWDAGMEVPLRASPAPGYRFVRWEGECSGRTNCTVSLQGARIDVTALFAKPTMRLALVVVGRGALHAGARWTCTRACSREVRSYAPVRVQARPAPGWRVKSWSGSCRGSGSTCVVPMERATGVRVLFARSGSDKP